MARTEKDIATNARGVANGEGATGATDASEPSASARSTKTRPAKRKRRRATATEHSELGEKLIAGVPARIMRPRLVFLCCLAALVCFGLLMVYSASSVEALTEQGSATYYLVRQAIFVGLGIIVMFAMCRLPWGFYRVVAPWPAWFVVAALLIVVLLIGAGGDTWGASRWIPLGFFNLQPAELAKPAVLLVAAKVLADYYEDTSIDTSTFLVMLVGCVIVPVVLIMLEPDLGTTIIIVVSVLLMAFICGVPWRVFITMGVVLLIVAGGFILSSPYRLKRLFVVLDPWSDPYGDGYQATLAIMAFASGGLFGRGIGNATMKYSYLPEAHNDYILAIIGEELGFVGTLIFIAVFIMLLVAASRIARRAPTLHAQLVASGAALLLGVQFFVNVLGILSVIPMTGKPLPFISYGGSSVLTSFILAALILRVSLMSNVETAADRRRASFAVMSEEDAVSSHMGRSTAGTARTRSSRRAAEVDEQTFAAEGVRRDSYGAPRSRSERSFNVYDGGRAPRERTPRAGGYERINLQGDGADRLRTSTARPRVDYQGIADTPRPRRTGDSRTGSHGSGRNGR